MRIQREIDLMLRRAHAAIGYAELDVWRATTDEAKAKANAKLSEARRALAEAFIVSTCHVRYFTLTPYLEGKGPRFLIVATQFHWELLMLPVGGTSILLAEGEDYPVSQGHALPYDEPKTIGSLLHFLVAYHPDSGSGACEGLEAPPYWVSKATLALAKTHLDALDMEAAEMENPHDTDEDDDDAEGE